MVSLSLSIRGRNGGIPGETIEGSMECNVGQIQRQSSIIPQSVSMGFHLCFGTFGGWPRFTPTTRAPTVAFANAAINAAGRCPDRVKNPTLDVIEDSFFARLADLNCSETQVSRCHSQQYDSQGDIKSFAGIFTEVRSFSLLRFRSSRARCHGGHHKRPQTGSYHR